MKTVRIQESTQHRKSKQKENTVLLHIHSATYFRRLCGKLDFELNEAFKLAGAGYFVKIKDKSFINKEVEY